MFIKVKGEGNEDLLVNVSQITFIAPNFQNNGCIIVFGAEIYARTNTSISELEQILMKSEGEG